MASKLSKPSPRNIIVAGFPGTGKSYIVNQLFFGFDSTIRFPLPSPQGSTTAKGFHSEVTQHPDDGTIYVITEIQGLEPQATISSLMSSIGNTNQINIIYVFNEFKEDDAKAVSSLSELVGFSNISLFKNKVTNMNNLDKETFMQEKDAVRQELLKAEVCSQEEKFLLWAVAVDNEPEIVGKSWVPKYHQFLQRKALETNQD